jgi:hypothetical protein
MMNDYGYYGYNDSQHLFDFTLKGLWIFLKLALKAVLYLPHLFTACLLATKLLDRHSNGLVWASAILFLSYVVFLLFCLLKAAIRSLKNRHHLLWLPVFIVAVIYSCIFPLWMIYEPADAFLQKQWSGNPVLYTITMGAFFRIYFRHHFLNPVNSKW